MLRSSPSFHRLTTPGSPAASVRAVARTGTPSAGSTDEDVVAAQSDYQVSATQAVDHVGPRGADQDVASLGPGEGAGGLTVPDDDQVGRDLPTATVQTLTDGPSVCRPIGASAGMASIVDRRGRERTSSVVMLGG